ncbi:MAG TPA: AAA family ATPase [Chloroflexota bacterium]|nr:AAA family ATPase [Chloroflexota bacterium]
MAALAAALALGAEERRGLHDLVRAPSPRRDATGPPTPTATATWQRLPVPPTPLIGREAEVAAIRALLEPASSTVRLLTLVGPGGVGKTRLALSVAAALDAAYPDGVVFVDIAPVHDHRLVPATIARTLGLRETAGRSARELLLEYLDKRQILLVLDNFEQVLPAAPLVADLLRVAPRVRVLVTSRVPLRLSGEHEVRVPPMILPSAGASAPEVLASEAVQLFVQRARAVRADFSSTLVTAPLIGAICARLDGLPLAIELAAARARHLPLDVLLARLGHRLDILDRGPLDLPERQRTLRATLDWSYDLLPAAEQRLFVALGVFVGGCTAEAAAAVSVLPDAVEDKMWALVDSAMLECVDPGSAVGEQFGAPRFRMLETVREYALAHLAETGEAARIHGLHAQYYLALTERAESELAGPRQRDWLGRLEREHDNLRAALDWCQTATAAAETGCVWQPACTGSGTWVAIWSRAFAGPRQPWRRVVVRLPLHGRRHFTGLVIWRGCWATTWWRASGWKRAPRPGDSSGISVAWPTLWPRWPSFLNLEPVVR